MRSKRGRKVHKYSAKRRRKMRPMRAIASVLFTFLIAGVVGIVGYSIAKPILLYTAEESSANLQTEEISAAITATLPQQTTAVTVVTEAATTAESAALSLQTGIRLSETALESMDTFSEAMAQARSLLPNGTILVIPLKISGGALQYQSSVAMATACDAVQGSLRLSDIVAAAEKQDWAVVAELSFLEDHLLPNADANAGYLVSDGSRWLDNTKENGGKAWTSPFSTVTIQYLTDIVKEVAAAGFSQIRCTDVEFPPFRQSDLAYIGESVEATDRYTALTDLVNTLVQAAGDIPLWVEIAATEAADGSAEVFAPEELTCAGVVLDFLSDTANIQTVLRQVRQKAGDLPLQIAAAAESNVPEEMQQLEEYTDDTVCGIVLE